MPRRSGPSKKEDAPVSPPKQHAVDTNGLVSLVPIRPYHVVADIACGTGYFTIPLGKHVFDGKVYAIDAQQDMLDATSQELKRVRLTNVELMLSSVEKLPLEDDSLDGVLAAFVMHGAKDRTRLLEETRRCLRRSGWLALLEWNRRQQDEGPPLDKRIDEPELRQMAQEVGFRFTTRHTLNDNQYMIIMSR